MAALRITAALLLLLTATGCHARPGSGIRVENWSGEDIRVVWAQRDKPESQWPVYSLKNSWWVRASGYNDGANNHDVLLFITRYDPFSPNAKKFSIFNDGWVSVGALTAENSSLGKPKMWARIDCQDRLDTLHCNGEGEFQKGVMSAETSFNVTNHKHTWMGIRYQRVADTADDIEWVVKLDRLPSLV